VSGPFLELVPLRPAERVILGPVPCQGCGASVAFTLPDPPLSFLGTWRRASARYSPARPPSGDPEYAVGTMAHRCTGAPRATREEMAAE